MKPIISILLIAISFSCMKSPETGIEKTITQSESEISGNLIADTIIYDVLIKATNPNDEWEIQRLQYVHHRAFVDSLFDLVYNQAIVAYDVFENKALTVSEVAAIEKQDDYARDRIGKIQFTEKWHFDPANQKLQKQVLSIALGYETYSEDGEVRAYKPVFKLYLN